ncbi:hypothetical protein AB0451_36655 [Streptomyces sp. NPDC052000]|uniref:hypothetical protein n=1 Tax=Streptomyces sp. NPDC052000 TaxID=3155676 RepID=UPI00344EC796
MLTRSGAALWWRWGESCLLLRGEPVEVALLSGEPASDVIAPPGHPGRDARQQRPWAARPT